MEEIIIRLGNPSKKFWDKITNEKTKKIYDKGGAKQDACFGIKISNPLVKDLINKCLIMEPEQRISAEDALKHKYFKIYHDPEDEPDFEGKIDDSFEYDNELTINKLEEAIIEEMEKTKEIDQTQDEEDSDESSISDGRDKEEFLKKDLKADIIANMPKPKDKSK